MICKFIKQDGSQCKAKALSNSKYCFFHSQESERARKKAQSKGGKNNKIRVRKPLKAIQIKETEDVVRLLASTIKDVRAGDLEVKIANCIGYLSGHLIKAFEASDLERRMEAIENYIERIKE